MGDEAVESVVKEAIDKGIVSPLNAPQVQKALAVPPNLAQEVIEILTTELPMKRVRGVVQMLEQCPVMDVNVAG